MPISLSVHGVIDYIVGLALVAAPWLFGFADFTHNAATSWTPVIIGSVILLMSLVTRYPYGALKVLPFPLHLMGDLLAGILLAASPWLFGFSHIVYLPHLAVGLLSLLVVALTDKRNVVYYKAHPLSRQLTPNRI